MSSGRHLTREKGKHRVHQIGYLTCQRHSHWLLTLVVALIVGLAQCETDSACSPGWFGPKCQYQCHCADESQCQSDGECKGDCAVFWFGPKCQYRYAALTKEGSREELTMLTDKNFETRVQISKETLYVDLVHPQRIHWLRVELKGGDINQASLLFWQKSETEARTKVCKNIDTRKDGDRKYYLLCKEPDFVHTISISSDAESLFLCSLHVAVGPNVAIKQKVSQSSTLKSWVAKNAVDGVIPRWSKDITEADLKKTCARTSVQESAKWKITLPREVQLSRITIHGGAKLPAEDCCQSDMEPVTVTALSMNDRLVFKTSLKLNESARDMEKTILPTETNGGLIKSVVISTTNRSLTLCEVQIFAEATCPRGFFGLNCEIECKCIRYDGTCHPATGKCPKGCDLGFKGPTCATPCAKGRYGFDCKKRCSYNCKVGSHGCRRDNGRCFSGCKNDYAPPYCTHRTCQKEGVFGKDCMFQCKCRSGIKNICDSVTGACLKNDDGRTSGNCRTDYFGRDCQQWTVETRHASHWALKDHNDNTCITSNEKTAYLTFLLYHRTLFVRIVAKNLKAVYGWSITLSGPKGSMSCHKQWHAQVEKNAVDFYCITSTVMNKVTISGASLKGLCSVFVSIGREHAFTRPTGMTSQYGRLFSYYGNDGKRTGVTKSDFKCAHTLHEGGVEQRWWVKLPAITNVTRISIENRGAKRFRFRLLRFGIRVKRGNILILAHRDKSTNREQAWFHLTRQLPYTTAVSNYAEVFSNRRYYLNFCAFWLFAAKYCPHGTYGRRCEHTCNCKKDGYCFPETGACSSGCRDGFRGYDCWQTCPVGTYGNGCKKTCSSHCFGGSVECSGVDGTCRQGCNEGYQPRTCDEVCIKGTYGRNCQKECSKGCGGEKSSLCNGKTGVCENPRCKPGYLGPRCDKICPPTNFGLDCSQNCSAACASPTCHHEDGRCDDCLRGKTGDWCEQKCPAHYHGPRCIYNCSIDCYQARCEPVLGRCKSCEIGLAGDYCKEWCEPGSYGWGCKERCSIHCKGGQTTCFVNNGSCMHGCENNMPPPRCQEPESLLDVIGTPMSMLLLLILLGLVLFFTMAERNPGPRHHYGGGEGGGTGSEVVHVSHLIGRSGISKERSTALSKEKTSSKSGKQERSKSKELTSGTQASQSGRPASSGKSM